jgi:hypothetical protein
LIALILGALISPWLFGLIIAWPAQVIRLALRDGDWAQAFFVTLGKLPEAQGALEYWFNRLRGVRGRLIEYK